MEKNKPKSNHYIHYKTSGPDPFTIEEPNIYKYEKKKPTEIRQDSSEPICLLGDKVYAFCQQKDCFPQYEMDTKNTGTQFQFIGIHFQEGKIVDGTMDIHPIGPMRPNFSRVRFNLKIPLSVRLRNSHSGEILIINGHLPELYKDVVLFMPEARDEFNYRIVVETRSELIGSPEIKEGSISLPVGIFSMVSVVGRVHIMVPAYCFKLDPPVGENFKDIVESICQQFDKRPFPDDFFPPQFEDIEF